MTVSLVLLVMVALAFDFMDSLHDAANSIATFVSTRVLKPQYAMVWAAFLVFGVHVANTVGKGIVDPTLVDDPLIFGALERGHGHCLCLGHHHAGGGPHRGPVLRASNAVRRLMPAGNHSFTILLSCAFRYEI